jgi:pimeloyl-ACP methyl ester carboxylesterase
MVRFQILTAQAPSSSERGISMVTVSGHAMRVRTANLSNRKPGQPVVVFEGGSIQPLETWNPVFNQVAAIAPAIAYDRRGVGKSEFDGEPQTFKHVTSSLHALLNELKVRPPYVLVGHSLGGVLIRAFASDFPTEVAGLVYVDAPATDITFAELDAISPDARRYVFDLGTLPPDLPPGAKAEFDNLAHFIQTEFAEARAARPPAGIASGVIISAGRFQNWPPEISARFLQLVIKHEQEWALSSPQGLIVVARHVGHFVHQDDPALTVQVIQHIVAAGSSK